MAQLIEENELVDNYPVHQVLSSDLSCWDLLTGLSTVSGRAKLSVILSGGWPYDSSVCSMLI